MKYSLFILLILISNISYAGKEDLKLAKIAYSLNEKYAKSMVEAINQCDLQKINYITKEIDKFEEKYPSYIKNYSSCAIMLISLRQFKGRAYPAENINKYGTPKPGYLYPGSYESCKASVIDTYKENRRNSLKKWHPNLGITPDPRTCEYKLPKKYIGNWVKPMEGGDKLLSRFTADLENYKSRWELKKDGSCEILSWSKVQPKKEKRYEFCNWEVLNNRIYLNEYKNGNYRTNFFEIEALNYRELVIKKGNISGSFYLDTN